jgi:outer membrane biogenesis lipoprotein LolB
MQKQRLIVLSIIGSLLLSACPPPVEDPPQKEHKPVDSLVATAWVWRAWGNTIILNFQTETMVHITNDEASSDLHYTYTGTTKSGSITDFNSSRMFYISDDGNTLSYLEWKGYGHGADFERQE